MYRYHDYKCGHCCHQWEVFEDRDAPRDQPCPKCGGVATRVFGCPHIQGTDTLLLQGTDDGFGPDNASRQMALAKAQAAGISVSGMKFHPGLCRRGVRFDPQAWYRDGADVKRKARQLGRCVEGAVNVTSPIFESDLAAQEKPYRVARHVVKEDVDREVAQCHGGKMTKAKREELYHKYVDKHSGSPAPKGKVKLPL
jgi:hypothetical protein